MIIFNMMDFLITVMFLLLVIISFGLLHVL